MFARQVFSNSHLFRFLVLVLIAVAMISLGTGANPAPSNTTGGPLFAVIPTLGIGGPLAILALLFPSLFGGVILLFRQWGAFFTVISINSLIYCLHLWLAPGFTQSFWGTQTALWLTMTFITLVGTVWSWRRNLIALQTPGMMNVAPPKTEYMVLGLLTVCCTALVVWYYFAPLPQVNTLWALIFILAAGFWVGLLYRLVCGVWNQLGSSVVGVPVEGVMLSTMLAGCILFVSWQAAPRGDTSEFAAAPGQLVAERATAKNHQIMLSRFDPFFGVDITKGTVLSSPRVVGDQVFIALADPDDADPTKGKGAVFCIDRTTNKIVWTFMDLIKEEDGTQKVNMQPVFSSPTIVNGKLYIGEGFHYNPNCKLYCLDAKTGKKLWDFTTGSQTEATPVVVDGRVIFGAGNDGVYALDAETGKKLWQYGSTSTLFRVGASAAVADGKVFFGSGVDRELEKTNPGGCETSLVCVDAARGKEIWKVKVDLPCWAAPVVSGDVVYFALGNGDIYFDAPSPGGAILCLDAKTGKQIWRENIANGVHTKPALDSQSIYFGSRDEHCYCLNRFSGKLRWKKQMGSPIFASPILDQGDLTGRAVNVIVLATQGRVSCLDAQTGEAHWSYHDLESLAAFLASTPTLALTPTPDGTRRQIYFGASLNNVTPCLYCLEDVLRVSE